MSANMPDPGPLMRLATAYWDSQAFLTANRLRLFDTLASNALTAEAIAAELKLDVRGTRLLLNALAGLGLLTVAAGRYSNSPATAAYLVGTSPAYLGNAIAYSDGLYGTWGRLDEALRAGRPALRAEEYLGRDPARTEVFVRGMHDRAVGIGRALAASVDLTGRKRLLDVGGGPGTYSVLLTQRFAGLTSEVIELPGVAAVARELVRAQGAAPRVTFIEGDYHTTPFGVHRDVVLMSGMFHRESPSNCRRLIAKAYDSLDPDGLLIVSDVFTDASGIAPVFATLFGLNMMLTAPEGGVHASPDVAAWLKDAGCVEVSERPFPPPMPHRIVCGRHP
ncbi:MAG: methyltransferase domain-containing protein [Proteobacteria bacterium]|nr:methyltransferase domain-containing protein [Pseudomonadota bacterium]